MLPGRRKAAILRARPPPLRAVFCFSHGTQALLPSSRQRSNGEQAHMDPAEFRRFFRALCEGEPWAVEERARRYRPFLCQVIRPWLTDARLRHLADSTDLYQVILVKFLGCLKRGRYQDLETPQQLEKLLCHMAKNAFRDLRRQERPAGRPRQPGSRVPAPETPEPADSASSPSQHAARAELA